MMWSYDNSLAFGLVLHETSRGGPAQFIFFAISRAGPVLGLNLAGQNS